MSTDPHSPPNLSERELQVLRLVATGATNNQIARDLQISVNTVKVHLNNIFAKLGVQSRTEAALSAVRHGWVDIPRPQAVGMLDPTALTRAVEPLAANVNAPERVAVSAESNVPPNPPQTVAQVASTATQRKLPLSRRSLMLVLLSGLILGMVFYPLASAGDAWRSYFAPRAANPPTPNLPPRWVAKAALPSAREAIAVTAVDGLIYAIGGAADGAPSADVSVYDPGTDTWSNKTPKPTAVLGAGAAVVGGRIYVPGGCDVQNRPTSVMEVYDPVRDSWQTGLSLPVALCRYAISAIEGKFYLFGGWNGNAEVANVYAFDPARGEWSERPSLPMPRADAESAVINERVYVVGGRRGEQVLSDVLVFDPAQSQPDKTAWSAKASMQHARAQFGLVALAGNLYAMSGGWSSALAENERYDTQSDRWSPIENTPEPLERVGGAAALETKVYLVGGWQGRATATVEEYTALYKVLVPSMVGTQ